MKLLFDVNRNRWYNENGDLFSGYRPSIPYGNTERVEIQLYSEITNANSGSAAVADWTKYTDLDGENYGAVLSVDNNFLHWFKTTLQGDLAAGSVATVSVATNESIDNIAESGDIYIYADSNATPEALEYTSRVKISGGIQFTLATGATLQNAYSAGSQVDIPEMLYAEALMIDEESDPATGLFVFDLVMDSPKLRNAMQYKSVERLTDVKGLELMIYQTGDNNTLKILKRFRCGSFSIEGGIADLKTGVPVPDTRQSEILALINTLLHQTDYPTTEEVRSIASAVIESGGYVVSSGAELIASGAVVAASSSLDERITEVSGGLQTQIDTVSGGLEQRPTSSGAKVIASGAALDVLSNGGYVSGGDVSGMLNASALPKNKPFSTTIGGYTVELTSGGGFSVYGSGASATLSGGAVNVSASQGIEAKFVNDDEAVGAVISAGLGGVTIAYDDTERTATLAVGQDITVNDGAGASVTLSEGAVNVSTAEVLTATYDNYDLGAAATVSIGYNGVGIHATGGNGDNDLVLDNTLGGITANGSAITQVSSVFSGTSLDIEELSGGVKYFCSSALSALSIGSAAPGCNGTILFTVASEAIVTPPSNVSYFGVTSYTPGSRYAMMVNGDMAVCNEAVSAAGV